MLVGVGLVELKTLKESGTLAEYLSPGLGGGDKAKTFALGILIYFAIFDFSLDLFGHEYTSGAGLRRPMRNCSKKLDDKLSRFVNDANAFALVSQQLNRSCIRRACNRSGID